jgi:hypothetical protein
VSAEPAHIKTQRIRKIGALVVEAVYGSHKVEPDPQFQLDMAAHLKEQLSREQLLEAFSHHARGTPTTGILMLKIRVRALVKQVGAGANISKNVFVIHPETVVVACLS